MKPEFKKLIPPDDKIKAVTIRVPETLFKQLGVVTTFDENTRSMNDLMLEGASSCASGSHC